MNLQPRRQRVPSSKLLAATGLSLALHGLLIWPLPLPRSTPDRPVAQVGALRLVPAAPAAATVTVAQDLPAAPQARLSIDRPPPLLTAAGRATSPGPDVGALSPVVAESSLRAFRYAIARTVARDGALLQATGVRMVIALRLHARRVVAVSLVRSSGHDAVDARVLAAFRAAASTAVMSVDLPPHGFAVELELDGESDAAEQDDAGQDERWSAPG
jgi:outer membrane biosynthesis protein TonB